MATKSRQQVAKGTIVAFSGFPKKEKKEQKRIDEVFEIWHYNYEEAEWQDEDVLFTRERDAIEHSKDNYKVWLVLKLVFPLPEE